MERNWTTSQSNKPFPESRVAPGLKNKQTNHTHKTKTHTNKKQPPQNTSLGGGEDGGGAAEDGGGGRVRGGRPCGLRATSTAFARPRGGGAGSAAVPAGRAPPARSRTRGRRPAPSPPPAPSPAASSRSPSPFPHVWVTSKFREKAAWWLGERRRDSAAQRPPPGAPGEARARAGPPCAPRRPGPAAAARQAPSAPNRVGKFTFRKRMRFQSYFRPREACPTAESDRKRGKLGSLYFLIFFLRKGSKTRGGRTDGRRRPAEPTPIARAAPARSPGPSCSAAPTVPPAGPQAPGDVAGGGRRREGPPEACSHLELPCPGFGETPVGASRTTHPPSSWLSSCRPFPLFLSHIFLVCSYSLLILPPLHPPNLSSYSSSRSFPIFPEPETGTGTYCHPLLSNRRVFGFGCLTIHPSQENHTGSFTLRGRQGRATAPIPEPELLPLLQPGLTAPTRRQRDSNSRNSEAWRLRDHPAGGRASAGLAREYVCLALQVPAEMCL